MSASWPPARPAGNTTGFLAFEYAISAKWLDLLKEIAPRVTRVAVLRDPTNAAGIGQFAAIQAVAPIGIERSALTCSSTCRIRGHRGADLAYLESIPAVHRLALGAGAVHHAASAARIGH
jgi:hypothetical protein